MKKAIGLLFLFMPVMLFAQTVGELRYDTLKLRKVGGNSELVLMNSTRDTLGVLVNIGGGKTRFIKSKIIGDTALIIGLDTLKITAPNNSDTTLWMLQDGNVVIKPIGSNRVVIEPMLQVNGELWLSGADGQIFTSGVTGQPTILNDKSIWFDNSTNKWKIREGGVTKDMIGADSALLQTIYRSDTAKTNFRNLIGDTGTLLTTNKVIAGSINETYSMLASLQAYIPTANWGITKINPAFIVVATGIPRATNSYSFGDPIEWELITDTDHGISFFDNIRGHGSNASLSITYPHVKNVMYGGCLTDETLVSNNINFGASVGADSMSIFGYKYASGGLTLVGNGTTTLTKQGSSSSVSVSNFNESTGVISVMSTPTVGTSNFNRWDLNVSYTGPNRYTIQSTTLESGYLYSFKIIDSNGNVLLTPPTSSDEFHINGLPLNNETFELRRWFYNNKILENTFANMWVFGVFEAWMVLNRIDATSFLVRWQEYPGAASYKIYRDTNSDFSTETLIYSGSDLTFVDTGLTTGTVYYYKMVAVISGVEVYVTKFVGKAQ